MDVRRLVIKGTDKTNAGSFVGSVLKDTLYKRRTLVGVSLKDVCKNAEARLTAGKA